MPNRSMSCRVVRFGRRRTVISSTRFASGERGADRFGAPPPRSRTNRDSHSDCLSHHRLAGSFCRDRKPVQGAVRPPPAPDDSRRASTGRSTSQAEIRRPPGDTATASPNHRPLAPPEQCRVPNQAVATRSSRAGRCGPTSSSPYPSGTLFVHSHSPPTSTVLGTDREEGTVRKGPAHARAPRPLRGRLSS